MYNGFFFDAIYSTLAKKLCEDLHMKSISDKDYWPVPILADTILCCCIWYLASTINIKISGFTAPFNHIN